MQDLTLHYRFFGLFGVYYSLQYLSLSDATVLTFLAPMFTIATGALFLGEKMHWKQAVAGCKSALFGFFSHHNVKLWPSMQPYWRDFDRATNIFVWKGIARIGHGGWNLRCCRRNRHGSGSYSCAATCGCWVSQSDPLCLFFPQ